MTQSLCEQATNPDAVNMDAGKLAKVVAKFRQQQVSGAFPGGQFVVRRNVKLVINEAVGLARG